MNPLSLEKILFGFLPPESEFQGPCAVWLHMECLRMKCNFLDQPGCMYKVVQVPPVLCGFSRAKHLFDLFG